MNSTIWTFCAERVARVERVVLIVVAATESETPAKAGFKMAIAANGAMSGTVGGGKAEHDLVECAKEMLTRGDPAPRIVRQVHRTGTATDASGMICGGAQTALFFHFTVQDLTTLIQISTSLQERRTGTIELSPTGIMWHAHHSDSGNISFTQTDILWTYRESVGTTPTAYLIGGGHVSLALSRILATLDFHIVVFDDRPDVDTMARNSYAHERHVLPFDTVHAHIAEGSSSYAAIMTPSHRADEEVLRSIIRKNLRYVGLMASPIKIEEVFRAMRRDGFTDEELSRVRTPIGLPIASHTPGEIAISIAAEMILRKNS